MAFYDPALDWFGRVFMALFDFLKGTFNKVTAFMLAPIVAFFSMVMRLINELESALNSMITQATNALGEATSLNLGSSIGIANYFVPLDLMFEYCVVLLGIWLVALVYRAIKSWIPTVA